MQTKAAATLYDYWTRRRGGRPVPLRSDIEPADLAVILPDLFILEHSAGANPCFRLAGTRLCAQFGRELKGTRFDALFAPDQRNRIARIAENIMAHRTPATLLVEATDAGLETTEVEITMLPLASKGRLADRIIGAFAPLPGRSPPRAALRYLALSAVSTIDTARAGSLLGQRPAVAVPTSVMTVRQADLLGRQMGRGVHLRVFEGGRTGEEGRN